MKPNIVFVFADQLRASSLGFVGEEAVITPNIDALAKRGAVFTTAVSATPICGPYRGSLLTGRSAVSTGLVLNDIPLPAESNTIGKTLKGEGYKTAYIGKWHLDGPDRLAPVPKDRRQGFDLWAAANFEHNYRRSKYFDDLDQPKVWTGFDAEAQTDRAIEFLNDSERSDPFCLFLSWGPPHNPYRMVPQTYLDMYEPGALTPRPNCPDMPREDLWGYYAQTSFLDTLLGRIIKTIDDLGLFDRTIVVFTSDHGDMHGSHGVYKKQWPWEESIRVPFVVSYPPAIAAGSRLQFPISVVDIMPTLLGLAGIQVPDSVEGVDLSPCIGGRRADPPSSVLLMNPCPSTVIDPRGEDIYPTFQGRRMEYRGVRTSRHTYIRTIEGPWLLYDNVEDPYQLENLIDDPSRRSLREECDFLMRGHMERIGDELAPREFYYAKFGLEVNQRGQIKNIVQNSYPDG
ncbi:MAG: sulfatase [Kiloniellales bacterium]|nr:sulfatase [Kiloniellales bacterium]